MFIYRTIDRSTKYQRIKDRHRSGRPRTVRTQDRIKRVCEKIRRDPQRSARKLAKEEKVGRGSMSIACQT